MENIVVNSSDLKVLEAKGDNTVFEFIVKSINDSIGGELNKETMSCLNSYQITLLAYSILREEVMEGGFIQLIHNGYGAFIFINPFAKIMDDWGLTEFHSLINKCHKLYCKYHDELERDCSDDEFMALYEKFSDFDIYDDEFVDHEDRWSNEIARFVNKNLNDFIKVI
jgi:hypothetical protein